MMATLLDLDNNYWIIFLLHIYKIMTSTKATFYYHKQMICWYFAHPIGNILVGLQYLLCALRYGSENFMDMN